MAFFFSPVFGYRALETGSARNMFKLAKVIHSI